MNLSKSTRPRARGDKKPIAGRLLAVAGVCLLICGLFGRDALAQSRQGEELRVTEKQAVQRALEQSDLMSAWGATVTEARAAAISERALPNPQISYSHEQSYEEPDAVGEDFLLVAQKLPLSGQRRLSARSAGAMAEARRHEVTGEMARTAARVRAMYYEVRYLRARIDVRVEWLEEVRELEDVLERRVEAGEAAEYDLERLRKQTADIAADIAVDRASLAEQQARLRGELYVSDEDGPIVPTDALLPAEIPENAALMEAVRARPEVAAAESRVEAAKLAERAASRWWVPEPTLTAGYRGASVGGEHYPGFVAGLSLALPIFSQNHGARLAAQARLERARSQRAVRLRQFSARVKGLAEQVRQLRRAAATYQEDGLERAARVVEVARESYDAGELSIIELLDAHRGWVDSRLKALELAKKARLREIELRRNLGKPDVDAETQSTK